MSDMKHITIYSTPICAPCKVAYKRLDAANVPFEPVDLTENPETLAELKRRLERPQIQTPLIQFGTKFVQINELTQIIADYKAQEGVS